MSENKITNTILCVFPIFCPSQKIFKRNKESILSFIEFIKRNPEYVEGNNNEIKLNIIYSGWAFKDEWWNELENLIKTNLPYAKCYRFDRNYGKSKIVNSIVSNYVISNPDTQFLFTCDSDIKFIPEQEVFFDRMLLAANCFQQYTKQSFGFFSLDQKEENCHWYNTHMDKNLSYDIIGKPLKEELVWPSSGQGIAGGALFINLKMWSIVNGYRQFNNPYCGEDGHLLRDAQLKGFCVAIIKTLSIIHPITDNDPDYVKYKQESMKEAFVPYDLNKYKENLNNSDEFWKAYNEKYKE